MVPVETASDLTQHYPAGILIVGYGLAGLCLIAYFLWEDGPFHRSRRVEHMYLTGILLLIYITSFFWNRWRGLTDQEITNEALRQFIRLLLTVNIVQSLVVARKHRPFFDEACASWRSRYSVAPPTPYAVRVSQELVKLIEQVSSGSRAMIIPTQALAPALLTLFMFEDLAWASRMVARRVRLVTFILDVSVLSFVILTQLRRIFKLGPRTDRIHEVVSEVVADRDKPTLRYLLASMSVGSLFEVANSATFYALVKTALEADLLDLTSKAILVDAMQKKGLQFSTKTQEAVKNLILSCTGRDLTILKNLLDGSGTYQNLFKMLYNDIKSESIQIELLRHIEIQSKVVREELGHAEGVKILSDIDDTLFASGGRFPNGTDKRFPRKVVYPGFLQLVQALDKAPSSGEIPSCNLVFVSARPHLYKSYAEDQSYKRFRDLVSEGRMHIMPTLLPGTLISGSRAALMAMRGIQRAWQPVGEQKFQTFRQYRALYSEYDFVFCGDNGQGDLLAGQHMMKEEPEPKPGRSAQMSAGQSGGGPNTLAVLIHEVLPAEDVLAMEHDEERDAAWREHLAEKQIFLFRTYVGAAVALHRCRPDVISLEDLLRICITAQSDFDRMRLMYYDWEERWVPAEEELRADFFLAAQVLHDAGLQLPRLKQTSVLLSTIHPVSSPLTLSSLTVEEEQPGWNIAAPKSDVEIEMADFTAVKSTSSKTSRRASSRMTESVGFARSDAFQDPIPENTAPKIICNVEEVRRELQEALARCRERRNPDELGVIMERARQAAVPHEELQAAEKLLKELDEERAVAREHAMEVVRIAVNASKMIDDRSMDSLLDAKSRLVSAIQGAKAVTVPEAALLDAENRRRRLHNKIEDIRGAIRVFCRVRPLSVEERQAGDTCITRQEDLMALQVEQETSPDEPSRFVFDAVFSPGTQEEIFDNCRDLVQSAVDGYNVTIFAHGQTGAGKTYTMYGESSQEGTTPRAVKELFNIVDRDRSRFDFTVSASMLELYRNELVDLFNKADPAKVTKKLNIHVDRSGMVQIDNLCVQECRDEAELLTALDNGNKQRAVAATIMNSQSSRSHLIIIVKVASINKETGSILQGKILMCDLAGSERLRKSTFGERQQEGIEINKSLSALGDVLEALTKGQKQVPYRNHKLTQVMQDSLGGNAKTLMIVNCSPSSSNVQDTLMALKYGARAKRITNTVHRAVNNMMKNRKIAAAFSER